MIKFKRVLSAIMLLCMIISMLPPVQIVSAAGAVTYELDTDGIDYGAEYLIVSGTGSTAYALNGAGTAGTATKISVVGGKTIEAFAAGMDCLWTFEERSNGSLAIRHGSTYLRIPTSSGNPVYQSSPAEITTVSKGNGGYGFYLKSGWTNYYLYLNGSKFRITYSIGTSSIKTLYLFKKIEDTTCSITFNGNGNTAGTLPSNEEELKEGSTYLIPKPSDDFRMDVGEDTYLFWCWTENQDGTGTEYRPGETITVDRDMTLYAQWYLQNKYQVTVITDLDDVHTDIEKILDTGDESVTLYVRLEGEDNPFLPLTRMEEGVYATKVAENGTYAVYAQYGEEEPEAEHGHRVIIYNQDGITELLNYSVTYDANGGTFPQKAPDANYHANTRVTATEQVPTLEGHRFLGWEDQNGNLIAPGGVVTEALLEKTVLTAKWEDLVDVTVEIAIHHESGNGQLDTDEARGALSFLLLQKVNGLDMPYGEMQYLDSTTEGNTTYYTVTFKDLPRGTYSVGCEKSHYTVSVENSSSEGDQTIQLDLRYAPDNFDLSFQVNVQMENIPEALRPQRINLRVTRWENGSWQDVDKRENSTPITVIVDENGNGTGFLPVWKKDGSNTCIYRVRVSSFVMPDGTVVYAESTQADVFYKPEGSGLYSAEVIVSGGQTPEDAQVSGVYYDGTNQVGDLTINVTVSPFTVTFDAGEGTLNGDASLILDNQYAYPDLENYIPVPNEAGGTFGGWYIEGEKAENLAGKYLTENVTYVAQYNPKKTISGTVFAGSTYKYIGNTIAIPEQDRIRTVRVVLQKNINGIYNDVDSRLVTITYTEDQGEGQYAFEDLPDDGTAYSIYVLQHNYEVAYDNNADENYTSDEFSVTEASKVNVSLQFMPETYTQEAIVDTSLVSEGFRPDAVQVEILYRDLGDSLPYKVISQQPNGIRVPVGQDGRGSGSEDVWKWHNNATLYEYQLNVTKLYGGVYTSEGKDFDETMPFTVRYDMPAYYTNGVSEQMKIKATLVPKEYRITFDLQLEDDPHGHVQGMDEFHVDTNDSNHYAYYHTWGVSDTITAYPYRPGFVFQGWKKHDSVIISSGGIINVGAELATDITLVAEWKELTGTGYSIRHLEKNTDKVLQRATTVEEGTLEGSSVKAVDGVLEIPGYTYVGAMVNGEYYDKSKDPELIVTTDPTQNVMVIYYMPDGSDGYTDQVEDNLYLDKQATLEDDGTYSIQIETFAKDNPITTQILQNTPMDIVLVLDQSASMGNHTGILGKLQSAAEGFIQHIADHGRENEVDHRVAIVGYACSGENSGFSDQNRYPIAGPGSNGLWVNTGVFDSNGDFHIYPVTGFNYTPYTGTVTTDGVYYTYADGEYQLLTFHESYRHLITEDEARKEVLKGTTVYGYVDDGFVELTRNTSGLWLYGDKKLYSAKEFFTFHTNVWTHRKGIEPRQIHGHMVNGKFQSADGHTGLFTRTETRDANPQKSIYQDALMPASVGGNGSGAMNPGLQKATKDIGANGKTHISYGMEMANSIFQANPLDGQDGRLRIVVVFTDGKPGDGSNFSEDEANRALELSYIASSTHKAKVYTIGLYGNDVLDATSDQTFFLNGLSSNYPEAQNMDDVWSGTAFEPVAYENQVYLNNSGPYYVCSENHTKHYLLRNSVGTVAGYTGYKSIWSFTDDTGRTTNVSVLDTSALHPVIVDGKVNGYQLCKKVGTGYKPTTNSGYYAEATSPEQLQAYFEDVVKSITTKITKEIILHDDTIVRDIMGQGLVLTPGTEIVAYKQNGTYDSTTQTVTWIGEKEELARVVIPENPSATIYSENKTSVEYKLPDGTVVSRQNVPFISVYNLTSENPTDPKGENYHPHTVDITGYDFDEWYLGDGNENGAKMIVTINRIEAQDDVAWGRATYTNQEESGLWLPMDENGNRELLLAFDQPTTIFVERAYVLDYGKEFELSGWYFDSEDGQEANAIHVDCEIENGMNWFNSKNPTKVNGGEYGNTRYGNVRIDNGKVTYTPVTTQWGDYDQFYVFGNTWRKTVLAQDANSNGDGNLWNKVTVIPANSVYYEDTFITEKSDGANSFSGFEFTGVWDTVYTNDDKNNAGQNKENPEHLEDPPYGDVHGWTDSLGDDVQYSDGSAHIAFVGGYDNEKGAKATFTFTGTGVDVYTRTNKNTGTVVAVLTRVDAGATPLVRSIATDNLSMSGDYYQIPTVSFTDLPYGTYEVMMIATLASDVATGAERYHYYLDGIRVYNPLGSVLNDAHDVVKEAYGKELSPVFTEIRDVMLRYGDFNYGIEDNGQMGAVFIDWIRDGQGTGNDKPGTNSTFEVGTTFNTYGPKNEVYLTHGQAIVLKVDPRNTYYVGMKTITPGKMAKVNVSGLNLADPTSISVGHTTDMYYEVTPMEGYIVIQNNSEDGALLALTKLRTTNMYAATADSGILEVASGEAVAAVYVFREALENQEAEKQPSVDGSAAETIVENNTKMTQQLFTNVRTWLQTGEGDAQ